MSDRSAAIVGILGAGLSGVLMGMQLRRAGMDDFVIYEKMPDVGGTWLRNTYPGLHCDIPSHLYCYSFEPNPDWSMIYSGQAEIQSYIRACAEKYDLVDNIRFDTSVESARFDEDEGGWMVETANGETAMHRVLVSATGGLTEPHLPRIEGLDAFEGPSWHSGDWRYDIDLAGKRVAVVGSAASAVQVVPEVAKDASEVFVFSRTPNWVTPRNNEFYSDDQKQSLRSDDEWRKLRRRQYRDSLVWQKAFDKHDAAITDLRDRTLSSMHSAIEDPELIAALTPDYDPGCKRILVSDDYYPALARDHVHLIPQGVSALTATGVVAAHGSETSVDVVIFCTGYKLGGRSDGRPALEVYGRDGVALRAALAKRPEAYRGMAIPGFPNYFTVVGVNGAVSYAPVFLSAELETEFIARWVDRIIEGNLKSVEAKPEVTHSYNEKIQAELQDMSWAGDCPSFYKDKSGRILSFFPGTVGRMRRELRSDHEEAFTVATF